jgi:hypothetical protein
MDHVNGGEGVDGELGDGAHEIWELLIGRLQELGRQTRSPGAETDKSTPPRTL